MDFVSKRYWFFLVSLLVIAPGILFLAIAPGLKPGIDFTGGSSITMEFRDPAEQERLRQSLIDAGQPDAIVQKSGESSFLVRTKELDEAAKNGLIDSITDSLGLTAGVELFTPQAGTTTDPAKTYIGVAFASPVTAAAIRDELSELGYPDADVDQTGDDSYRVVTETLTEDEKTKLVDALEDKLSPPIKVLSFDLVSPVVAFETVRNAFYAVLAAAVGIFFYVWWAFRNVPSPFRYGTAAVIALLHDSLVVIGIFAMLGVLFDVEVNTMFLIALLTVVGYSVNDTIVIFDRLRENVLLYPNRSLASNANLSISESLGRSMNTSLTLLFTLLALILFGGPTIRVFLWVLLIGVIAGTYSSIGVATQVLMVWEYGDIRRIFGRSAGTAPAAEVTQAG